MILTQSKMKKPSLITPSQRSILKFKEWLDQIYLEQASATELFDDNDQSQFFVPSGEAYAFLRQKMQQITTIVRRLINNSLEVIFRHDSPTLPQMEAAIWIISDHFQALCASNHQVWLLWQGSFKTFDLNEDNINQLTFKEIVPTNPVVAFRKLYEYMPKMFDQRRGQKIKKLHQHAALMFSSIQLNEKRQETNRKCQMLKREIDQLIQTSVNVQKGIEQSERLKRARTQSDEQKDQKKPKKKRNKKKKKANQNNDNTLDDLPDLIKIESPDVPDFLHTKSEQLPNRDGTEPKGESSKKQTMNWSQQELSLLKFIENLEIVEQDRIACNTTVQYIDQINNEVQIIIKQETECKKRKKTIKNKD